jgi:hypothetical protein
MTEEPQVITRAQERLFSGPKQKGANIITLGYRSVCLSCGYYRCILILSSIEVLSKRLEDANRRSRVPVSIIIFVNTIVYRIARARLGEATGEVNSYFLLGVFTCLTPDIVLRIGESAMLHLLTQASIFVPLPNECLCQLTGLPLNFLPSPAIDLANSASTVPVPSAKRKRKASPHPEAPSVKKQFQPSSGSSE